MNISSKHRFYLTLGCELFFFPYKYLINFFKWNFVKPDKKPMLNRVRAPVLKNNVAVCVHEWGGYDSIRFKEIKNYKKFQCGLFYQLSRYLTYKGEYELDLTVTISERFLQKEEIKGVNVMEVSNLGMDFSGYKEFYDSLKTCDNQYVILSNTSVNKLQCDFIDSYLNYFKSNESIGMLGVSVSSKIYQSLIRNNFNPHLQSFFLLTTTAVLNEIVEKNGGFPGYEIGHKLLLIREGEVKLSRIALNLGYKLACVLENGEPFLFDKSSFKDNGKSSWNIPRGDYRLHVENPNSINALVLKC